MRESGAPQRAQCGHAARGRPTKGVLAVSVEVRTHRDGAVGVDCVGDGPGRKIGQKTQTHYSLGRRPSEGFAPATVVPEAHDGRSVGADTIGIAESPTWEKAEADHSAGGSPVKSLHAEGWRAALSDNDRAVEAHPLGRGEGAA